ncbi:MAG: VOC family protein [Pyrinomonadaceae bacterium]
MQKLTPFLWFDTQAEEAANLYTSIFKNSRVLNVARYPEGSPGGMAGKVMTVQFELDGLEFTALNAGPQFKFTEAVSFVVNCGSQEEVDHFWDKLTADGGEESMCGWLKDKFGLSWQITPTILPELISSSDTEKAQKAMNAMLQMRKIDIQALRDAVA